MRRLRTTMALLSTLSLLFCQAVQGQRGTNEALRICNNESLRKAIRIIESACTATQCDFEALMALDHQVDKGALLGALRDPDLKPVHIFFPVNETDVRNAFDWKSTKKAQLDSIQFLSEPGRAAVFVIGRASTLGAPDPNRRLSIRRMQSILNYLKYDLKIDCHAFHGGYLGEQILQLELSDARTLNIEPSDFRNDKYILNQSVHVFVFPCAEML